MSEFYKLTGRDVEPCSMEEWAKSLEYSASFRVAETHDELATVSTVFLGLDYSFGSGPPLIFETMIFGGPHDEYQTRCSTWDEAITMHEVACKLAFGDEDDQLA